MPRWLDPIGRRWTKRNPGIHPAAMTVDAIPHDLSYKPTNPPETGNAVELCHAERRVIAMPLRDQGSVFVEVCLAAAGPDAAIGRHPFHQDFKVAPRQTEIEIQLA